MSVLKIAFSLSLFFLLISCGEKNIKKLPKPTAVKVAAPLPPIQPATPTSNVILPIWVDDPRLVNYISAIGSSKVKKWGGEQAQYNAAIEQARVNLEKAFHKHQMKLKVQSKPSTNHDTSDNIAKLIFENSIVKEEWKHPETGQLYLWLVVPDFNN